MVKNVLLVIALAGCFGSGPEPTAATGVTVVFHVDAPQNGGCAGTFIADVSIGNDIGVVATGPYQPFNSGDNCNTGGGFSGPVDIFQFPKNGGAGMMIGNAGQAMNGSFIPVRVSAAASMASYAFWNNGNGNIEIQPTNVSIQAGGMGPQPYPAGLLVDASTSPGIAYIGGWNNGANSVGLMSPTFPCCNGGAPGGNGTSYSLYKVPMMAGASPTKLAVSPKFYCESVRKCMVQNPSTLFYIQHADPAHVATINAFPKTGTAASDELTIGTIDGSNAFKPTGLAADNMHVAWTSSLDFPSLSGIQNPTTLPDPACAVSVAGLTGGSMELLRTTAFSCMDIAVDSTAVYFTIVGLIDSGHGVVETGLGIGRISLADHTFESIALGISGFGAGPRGVAQDTDSIYLLDPLTIAVISKSALDGRHDFTP